METKNVKLPVELIDSIKKRDPDRPPGEVLLEIYKEYEYVESVAHRVANVKDGDRIKITEAIDKFFIDTKAELDSIRASNDELSTMLKGLQLFLTKVKA